MQPRSVTIKRCWKMCCLLMLSFTRNKVLWHIANTTNRPIGQMLKILSFIISMTSLVNSRSYNKQVMLKTLLPKEGMGH